MKLTRAEPRSGEWSAWTIPSLPGARIYGQANTLDDEETAAGHYRRRLSVQFYALVDDRGRDYWGTPHRTGWMIHTEPTLRELRAWTEEHADDVTATLAANEAARAARQRSLDA